MDLSAWISLAALVVAGIAIVLPLWRERHASISLTLDEVYLRKEGGDETIYRLVARNAGPSTAEDIHIELFGHTSRIDPGVLHFGPDLDRLHAGQDFHMPATFSLADEFPRSATVTWSAAGKKTTRHMLVSQRPVL
jgi:hypothetical protein